MSSGTRDELARQLLAAHRRIVALDVEHGVRIKLLRRLTALCDATKVPGADPGHCARRLESLLAELDKPAGRDRPDTTGETNPH